MSINVHFCQLISIFLYLFIGVGCVACEYSLVIEISGNLPRKMLICSVIFNVHIIAIHYTAQTKIKPFYYIKEENEAYLL